MARTPGDAPTTPPNPATGRCYGGDAHPAPPNTATGRCHGGTETAAVALDDLVYRACTVPHRGWSVHRHAAQLVRDLSRDAANGYATEGQAIATLAGALYRLFGQIVPASSGLGWFWLGVIESGLGQVDWWLVASRLWADAHPPAAAETPHAAIAAIATTTDHAEEGG